MARQTGLGFADGIEKELKKRANTSQIKATQSSQGQKLYKTTNTVTPPASNLPNKKVDNTVPTNLPGGAVEPTYEKYTGDITGKGLTQIMPKNTDKVENNTVVNVPQTETQEEKKQPSSPIITQADLFKQMQEAKAQKLRDQYNALFQQGQADLEAEKTQVGQQYDEMRRKIDIDDTMARKAMENILTQQGLAASGARGQSELTQNIATQGAIGSARIERQNAMQDIQRRLQQLKLERDLGIAGGEADLSIATLENQMNQLAKEEELAKADELRAKEEYINTIGRFSQDFAAEMNRVQNDGDPSNDWQLAYLQAARQEKLKDMESQKTDQADKSMALAWDKWSAGIPLTETEQGLLNVQTATKPIISSGGGSGSTFTPSQAWDNAMEKWNMGFQLTDDERKLIGAPSNINSNASGGGGIYPTNPIYSSTDITKALDSAIDRTEKDVSQSQMNEYNKKLKVLQDQLIEAGDDFFKKRIIQAQIDNLQKPSGQTTTEQDKQSVLEWLVQNGSMITDQQLIEILPKYGISTAEFDAYEEWRNKALNSKAFE